MLPGTHFHKKVGLCDACVYRREDGENVLLFAIMMCEGRGQDLAI